MKEIRIKNVRKALHGVDILRNLTLVLPAGKIFVLLGPSGCGKTTLLRLIAGLESVDSGSIFFGDQDISAWPIHKRPFSVVFQNYGLFPHMTVYDNVSYALRIKKIPDELIRKKVERFLETFRLTPHANKLPDQLSGGQQQRTALIRALINDPAGLLLDEPLAALEFALRQQLLVELKEVQTMQANTFLYVTHDQFEALSIADTMAIMNAHGEIEQMGSPKAIYEYPVSQFVATFVGSTNLIHGHWITLEDGGLALEVGGVGILPISTQEIQAHPLLRAGAPGVVSLRPEKIRIGTGRAGSDDASVAGEVLSVNYQGSSTQYRIRVGRDICLQVFAKNEEHAFQQPIRRLDNVTVSWSTEAMVVLER